jgi:uncharacterized protein involved in response to NO
MPLVLFNLGFRVFFLFAALFSLLAMSLWIGPRFLSQTLWHAHEMVFGYAVAVIAGFLLTAVRNWTGRKTPEGSTLAALASIWLLSRILALSPETLLFSAIGDAVFLLALWLAVARPIVAVRQWRQTPVLVSLLVVLAAQLIYLWGVLNRQAEIQLTGIYLGFYAEIGLILVIAGRIVPFFTRSGLNLPQTLTSPAWLEKILLPLYALFVAVLLGWPGSPLLRWLAAVLAGLNGIRLMRWHTPSIWRKPLLWVLFVAYGWLIAGFVLLALGKPRLALHAFSVGGLGGITLGMMSRVSLGHTGRNLHQPPAILGLVFALLFLAAVARVLLPWLMPGQALLWYRLAGLAWIFAFGLFTGVYAPILSRPRVDGRPG